MQVQTAQLSLWGGNQEVREYPAYVPRRSHPNGVGPSVAIVDLFSGIGGFHIGLEHAADRLGYRLGLLFACDIEPYASVVYANNFGVAPYGDIQEIDSSAATGADLICAGFPCQPFSNSGLKRGLSDSRGTLYEHIERFVGACTPKAFLLENVSGILTNGNGSLKMSSLHAEGHARRIGTTMQHLEERLQGLVDYEVTWCQLDSSRFGSPQVRRRVFIVGIRKDLRYRDFGFPSGQRTSIR